MFWLVLRIILARRERSALLILGVLIVSSAYGLLLSAVETTKVIVNDDIAQSWRTTYDILIRPPGSRSPIEKKYGLVQANHLSNLDGGITLGQYEAIRDIPGVEVAAPIAMLGYFNLLFSSPLDVNCEPGIYRLVNSLTADNGVQEYWIDGEEFFYCTEPGDEFYHLFNNGFYGWNSHIFNGRQDPEAAPWYRRAVFILPVLLAAVDPEQEKQLVGLDRGIVSGEYLHEAGSSAEGAGSDIPIILNASTYTDVILKTEWQRIQVPFSQEMLDKTKGEAGKQAFAGQTAVAIQSWIYTGEQAYQSAYASLLGSEQRITTNMLDALPTGVTYREISLLPGVKGPVLEAMPLGASLFEGGLRAINMPPVDYTRELNFRERGTGGMGGDLPFLVQGLYDIERLPHPETVSDVPLETYYPPGVLYRYDESGHLVDPVLMRPNLSQVGYITSPPLALTTLESGAKLNFVRQDAPISAIRVRVAGIEAFTPEAREKVEQVAAAIIDRTGLDVDITVGSSPKRILVHIPGYKDIPALGYVEEGWVQMGVSYSIAREVQRINVLLFSVMLLVSGVYILNTSLVSTLARRREIALQKALGWRSSAVFSLVLSEGVLTGLVAGLLGFGLALLLSTALDLEMPLQKAIWILPLGLGLSFLGSLLPATLAARTSPAQTLARGEITASSVRLGRLSIPAYALRQALRRRARASLAILTMAISAALITLFLGIILYTRGYLTGTLLGEYILVHIGQLHFLIAGISFLIAGFATADVLLMAVIERRREVGILKAIGWRDRKVFNLFVMEAVWLAGIAGVIGWGAGCLFFWYLYRSLPLAGLGLLFPALLIPVLVSALAAFYPARQAAQAPPAEAMRYE